MSDVWCGADYRLRLRGNMCLQQTDLSVDDGVGKQEVEDGEEEEEEDCDDGAEGSEDGQGDEDGKVVEEGMGGAQSKTFVLSLFGTRDDVKAHYTAGKARFCNATWEAFLKYTGASADDIWPSVPEADRKLWSVRFLTSKDITLMLAIVWLGCVVGGCACITKGTRWAGSPAYLLHVWVDNPWMLLTRACLPEW